MAFGWFLVPLWKNVCTLSHNLECTPLPVEWAALFLFPWSINGCFQLVSDTSVRHRQDYQICQGLTNVWLNVALWLTPRDSSHNHFRRSSGWTSLWGKRFILIHKLFWFIYSDRIQIQFFISWCHCKSLFLCLEIKYVKIYDFPFSASHHTFVNDLAMLFTVQIYVHRGPCC